MENNERKANAKKWGLRLYGIVVVIGLMRLFGAVLSGDVNRIAPAIISLVLASPIYGGLGYILGYAFGSRK